MGGGGGSPTVVSYIHSPPNPPPPPRPKVAGRVGTGTLGDLRVLFGSHFERPYTEQTAVGPGTFDPRNNGRSWMDRDDRHSNSALCPPKIVLKTATRRRLVLILLSNPKSRLRSQRV